MIDKPKRKDGEPNSRRYWWIFGTLAFFVIVPFRIPENVIIPLFGYLIVFVFSIVVLSVFIWHYGVRHSIILLMLGCLILPIVQSVFMVQHEFVSPLPYDCESEQHGVLQIKTCTEHCFTRRINERLSYSTRYVTFMELPVFILIEPVWDENFMSDCYGS